MSNWLERCRRAWTRSMTGLRLAPDDLLRDATYRRLWTSILISSFGGQVTMLALPLTAAVLLHASPTQMGLLTAMEIIPFVLFSLPSGVWLDRVRKLPVYVLGETALAFIVASVPFAWWMGWLSMPWMYVVGFVIGTVYTTAGTAAQIVLTRVVARDLRAGVNFVRRQKLLVSLASVVGIWQMCHHAAIVVQILFATRTLGLSEQAVGLSYMGMGLGTIVASVFGNRISRHIGPGPCLVIGFAVCAAGWLLLAVAPANAYGVAAFAAMLLCFSAGAVLIFINFLALRQAVTPEPLLGRMTSTMRWLILIPAGPGALLGGWLGEHIGLRAALGFAGGTATLLALVAWHHPVIRGVKVLPKPESADEWIGAEADVRPMVAIEDDEPLAPVHPAAPAVEPSPEMPARVA